jgi:protein TonB
MALANHALRAPSAVRLRRRDDQDLGSRAARDRLIGMLLLAGLAHALLVLGVGFTPPSPKQSSAQRLEVLLVSDQLPEARRNDSASYLAQRSQLGSGNTSKPGAARIPSPPGGGGDNGAPSTAEGQAAESVLTTTDAQAPQHRSKPNLLPAATVSLAPMGLVGTPGRSTTPAPAFDSADDLSLRGPTKDELFISADTRAEELAPYLDAWRRRVERIGTLNFPSSAQREGLRGSPVIEVQLGTDGRLLSATLQRSSGNAVIDDAALQILRLASPFEALPAPLARQYRSLRFAYEWQFNGGRLQSGSVSVP